MRDGSDQLAVSQNNVDIPDPEILTQIPVPPRERQSENPLVPLNNATPVKQGEGRSGQSHCQHRAEALQQAWQ
jgi:hypothetical protein